MRGKPACAHFTRPDIMLVMYLCAHTFDHRLSARWLGPRPAVSPSLTYHQTQPGAILGIRRGRLEPGIAKLALYPASGSTTAAAYLSRAASSHAVN